MSDDSVRNFDEQVGIDPEICCQPKDVEWDGVSPPKSPVNVHGARYVSVSPSKGKELTQTDTFSSQSTDVSLQNEKADASACLSDIPREVLNPKQSTAKSVAQRRLELERRGQQALSRVGVPPDLCGAKGWKSGHISSMGIGLPGLMKATLSGTLPEPITPKSRDMITQDCHASIDEGARALGDGCDKVEVRAGGTTMHRPKCYDEQAKSPVRLPGMATKSRSMNAQQSRMLHELQHVIANRRTSSVDEENASVRDCSVVHESNGTVDVAHQGSMGERRPAEDLDDLKPPPFNRM